MRGVAHNLKSTDNGVTDWEAKVEELTTKSEEQAVATFAIRPRRNAVEQLASAAYATATVCATTTLLVGHNNSAKKQPSPGATSTRVGRRADESDPVASRAFGPPWVGLRHRAEWDGGGRRVNVGRKGQERLGQRHRDHVGIAKALQYAKFGLRALVPEFDGHQKGPGRAATQEGHASLWRHHAGDRARARRPEEGSQNTSCDVASAEGVKVFYTLCGELC